MLPHESHGYQARESVEEVLADQIEWFNRYVKEMPPVKSE
jgi:dipeptidyl aminopeptidase/acylaminoacyl peptidase